MGDELPGNLTGNYFVRAMASAHFEVRNLCPRRRDRAEIRRQALKLRFWPEKHPTDQAGTILDVDWSWIRALRSVSKIGELRIDDTIAGHDNLRVIFSIGRPTAKAHMPIIWILAVMQKKRDEFTAANIKTFIARHKLVQKRYCDL